MRGNIFEIILACALIPPAIVYATSEPTPTSVCAIRSHPEQFVGKRVTFDAKVDCDGVERTMLLDIDESRCKGGIVPLEAPSKSKGKTGMDKLTKALFTGMPGALDKRIRAKFTGKVTLGEPERFMLAPGNEIPIMTIDSIDDLHIEPISIPSAK